MIVLPSAYPAFGDTPFQLKMTTQHVYMAFLSCTEELLVAKAACNVSYDRSASRYNVSEVMDSATDMTIFKYAVSALQPIREESAFALVYASYLATWILEQENDSLEVPDQARRYIERIDPLYREANNGISVYSQAKLTFHNSHGNLEGIKNSEALINAEMKAYKNKSDTDKVDEKAGSVVQVDFGKKN